MGEVPFNQLDDDCDPRTPDSSIIIFPTDGDLDGYNADSDCDDTDPTIYPGAPDPADGVDRDCDGLDVFPFPSGALFVSGTTGSDTNLGTATSPFQTLTHAILTSQTPGDVIFVAEGDYSEMLPLVDDSILGGYSTDFATWDSSLYTTRIIGMSSGGAISAHGAPDVIWGGLTIYAEIDTGVSLYDGSATLVRSSVDGGMNGVSTNPGTTLTIRDTDVLSRSGPAVGIGGTGTLKNVIADGATIGVEVYGGTASVYDSDITGVDAGVKEWSGGSVTVTRSAIRGRDAGLTSQTSATVRRCTVDALGDTTLTDTSAIWSTGDIVIDRTTARANPGTEGAHGGQFTGTAVITNSVFLAANAPFRSHGVEIFQSAQVTMVHSYARGNDAASSSLGVYAWQGGNVTLVNNVIDAVGPSANSVYPVYVGENVTATVRGALFPDGACTIGFGGFPGFQSHCLDVSLAAACTNWPYGCTEAGDLYAGDPAFMNPLSRWIPGRNSAAIDMGVDATPYLIDRTPLAVDLYGMHRPDGLAPDLGPAEGLGNIISTGI